MSSCIVTKLVLLSVIKYLNHQQNHLQISLLFIDFVIAYISDLQAATVYILCLQLMQSSVGVWTEKPAPLTRLHIPIC